MFTANRLEKGVIIVNLMNHNLLMVRVQFIKCIKVFRLVSVQKGRKPAWQGAGIAPGNPSVFPPSLEVRCAFRKIPWMGIDDNWARGKSDLHQFPLYGLLLD